MRQVDAEARDVALGQREVPAGPDDPGQVRTGLQRPSVDRQAAVPDQQRARVPVGDGLRDGFVQSGRTGRADAGMAVRVDQTGHQKPFGHQGSRTIEGFEGDPAVADPQIPLPALRQHHAPEMLCYRRLCALTRSHALGGNRGAAS